MNRVAIGLLILLFVCSCSPSKHTVNEGEIPGEYSADYYGSIDKLRIYKDGSFEHVYLHNEKTVIEKDEWKILEKADDGTSLVLVLSNFSFRQKNGSINKKMDWFANAEKSSRITLSDNKNNKSKLAVRLCFNIDMDYCFVKS
ncbi:hypothetical protein ACUR5C_13970 [Aliikangiella sp. IMCC44653]